LLNKITKASYTPYWPQKVEGNSKFVGCTGLKLIVW